MNVVCWQSLRTVKKSINLKIHAAHTKRGKRVQRMNSHNWLISFFLIAGECGARFEANHCALKKTEKKKKKEIFSPVSDVIVVDV